MELTLKIEKRICPRFENYLSHSRADLLVYRLLELLVVEDGPHLAVAVAGPEGGGDLYLGLTDIRPLQLVTIDH